MHKDYISWKSHKIQIERKKFYRRLSVYVEANQSVRVKAAKLVSKRSILKFLDMNSAWIEKQISRFDEIKGIYPEIKYTLGEKVPLLGYQLEIAAGDKAEHYLKDGKIFLPPSENLKKELLKAYKEIAEQSMPERLNFWQKEMGLEIRSLKIRAYKARWGSCSNRAEIALNWKLVAAPKAVMDYVMIHELCHIKHMNHSKDFWALVSHYCPDYMLLRKWLKKHHFYFDFLEEKSELYS